MKKICKRFFYSGLLRFLAFLTLGLVPLLCLKLIPSADLVFFIDVLILVCLIAAIIGACVYVLYHYSSIDKNLKPVVHMAEVGELAARVAHDLRSPLSGTRAVLEFLHAERSGDKNFVSHLNLLEMSANKLEKIAQDLLKRNKGQEEEESLFSLHEVLDEIIGEYSSQPVLAGIRFVKDYAAQAVFLKGYRNHIERMFTNIAKNAIEAMDFEGKLTFATTLSGENVIVSIQDTGPGMSAETIQKLLGGRFTKGKKDGNGIGVSFVKEVLLKHGGNLKIVSEKNKGACFRLTLPMAQEISGSLTLETVAEKPIIVIDDDLGMLEQWRIKLEQQNVTALLFSKYEEMEENRMTADAEHTVIVDYHFDNSELNGMEIIAKLREKGFTRVYLCTAEYWKPSLKKLALAEKVEVYPKPLPHIVIARSPEGTTKQSPVVANGDCFADVHNDSTAPKQGYNVLVVDDDKVIRQSWELMQGHLKIATLHLFANLEALQTSSIDYNKLDIAFVDKNIGGSQFNGSDVIAFLKSRHVSKIVLASGENPNDLKTDPQFAHADFIIRDKVPMSFKEFFPS